MPMRTLRSAQVGSPSTRCAPRMLPVASAPLMRANISRICPPLSHLHRDWGPPLPHLHLDWARPLTPLDLSASNGRTDATELRNRQDRGTEQGLRQCGTESRAF